LRLLGAFGAGGAAVAVGAQATSPQDFGCMIREGIVNAVRNLLQPPAVAVVAGSANDAAVLQGAVEALKLALQAQRTASSWRAGMVASLAVVAGVAVVGWGRLGWVTNAQLRDGLNSVHKAISAACRHLMETMNARFSAVENALVETSEALKTELKQEVLAVGQSVTALEQRLAPIEQDARRSAQGIELLCEVVASSGLLANANAESLRRLDHFTEMDNGGRTHTQQAALTAPAYARGEVPSVHASAAVDLERAVPAFVRACMEPQPASASAQ
jgi:hypothetical protein